MYTMLHLDYTHYFFALCLPLPPPPFLDDGGAACRRCVMGKYEASVVGTNPGSGQQYIPIYKGTCEPYVYTYRCGTGI